MTRLISYAALASLLIAVTAGSARADAAPAKPADAAPAAKPAGSGDMDFDLLGSPTKTQTPKESMDQARKQAAFDKKVRTRRLMIKWHTALGFLTLVGLSATNIIGTLSYVDKYGGGNDDARYYDAHAGLAEATTVIFAATGALGLFAPNPYPKPVKFDAAMVHKLSMAIAAAGFLTQIILGPITASREGHLDQKDFALAHLVVGWGTYAFMATGTLAYVF